MVNISQPSNRDTMIDILKGLTIFLIGMPGTGKSTVGKALAAQLDYRFFDSDEVIEKVAGQTITEIFKTKGEETFRDLESQVLQQLCAYTKSVIATGGGIILKQMNWGYLRHGLIIWLDVPIDVILERDLGTNRPLLEEVDRREKLEFLLTQRQPLYAEADLRIAITSEQTPEQIVSQILDQIPTALK